MDTHGPLLTPAHDRDEHAHGQHDHDQGDHDHERGHGSGIVARLRDLIAPHSHDLADKVDPAL